MRVRSSRWPSARTARWVAGVRPAARTLAPEPAPIEARAYRTVSRRPLAGSRPPRRSGTCRHAVELHALPGKITKPGEYRAAASSSGSPEREAKLAQCRPRAPAAVRAPVQQSVYLEAHRQPVRGRSGEPGPLAQLGKPAGLAAAAQSNPTALSSTPSAMLSHEPILTSGMWEV